jgi:hypothetical protein
MRRPDAARVHVLRHRFSQRRGWLSAILAPFMFVIAVSQPSLLLAHSWYPPQCCTGQDCKKVDGMEHLPDGSLLMHFGGQQVIVPRGFSMQPSQDMDAHVCVFRGVTGRWLPRCVFLPTTAMLPMRK